MATSTEKGPARQALNASERIHIADVQKDLPSNASDNRYIEATVQLVWPYSSRISELSFLLVEKDVSLQATAAQVRAIFHGPCAKEVAQSKIGIGDTLRLNLRGAVAQSRQEELSTPGKKPSFDLLYDRIANLRAVADDGTTKTIDYVAPDPVVVVNGSHLTPETPLRNGSIDIRKTRLVSSSIPVLKPSPRISSNSYPGSLVDPFTEEDGYAYGRGRKRTKFARRSNQWRLADKSDEESILDDDVAASPVLIEPKLQSIPVLDDTDFEPVAETFTTHNERASEEAVNTTGEKEQQTEFLENRNADGLSFRRPPSKGNAEPSRDLYTTENLPATPIQPQIMVDQMTVPPTDVETTIIPTPRLTALTSPGLPMVSPLLFRTQNFQPMYETSGLNTDAPNADQTVPNQLSLPREDSYGFSQLTGQVFAQPSTSIEQVFDSVESAQPADALQSQTAGAFDIDLDKLQEQIDTHNFIPEVLEMVIEDDDMYGAPADLEAGMDMDNIDEIRSRMSSIEAETHNHHRPLDSQDSLDIGDSAYTTRDHRLPAQQTSLPDDGPIISSSTTGATFHPYPFLFEVPTAVPDGRPELDIESEITRFQQRAPFHSSSDAQAQHLSENVDNLPDQQTLDAESPRVTLPLMPQPTARRLSDVPLVAHGTAEVPTRSFDEQRDEMSPIQAHDFAFTSADTGTAPHEPEAGTSVQVSDSGDPHSMKYRPSAPADLMTPDATQVAHENLRDGPMADKQDVERLPPTPAQSQATNTQPLLEESALNTGTVEEELPEIDLTPFRLRRTYDGTSHGQEEFEGIASPYFTPYTSSYVQGPGNKIQTTKDRTAPAERSRISTPEDAFAEAFESDDVSAMPHHEEILSDEPTQSQIDTQRVIATPLEHYVRLNMLNEFYNQQVDVIAVCTADSTMPDRAKSGPKDFFTTITLADSSGQEGYTSIIIQIFRPRKAAIPVVKQGDVLLLRRFKVQTKSRKPMLLSTDDSAWAVYKADGSGGVKAGRVKSPTISGPPVEHGMLEHEAATNLLHWWRRHKADKQNERSQDHALSPAQEETDKGGEKTRFRKPAPAPIELRRSPRRTRKEADINTSQSHTSPIFTPSSPARSQAALQSPEATSSLKSRPTPTRNLRSHKSPANPDQQSPTSPSINSPPMKSPIEKPNTRFQKSLSPSTPDRHGHDNNLLHVADTGTRNFSSSNSVTSSVTQTSGSSKKRRYERRSTSLIHQLRDGTEWVDVEEVEEFSVTDSEDEEDNDEDQEEDAQSVPEADSQIVDQDVATKEAAGIEGQSSSLNRGEREVDDDLDPAAPEIITNQEATRDPPPALEPSASNHKGSKEKKRRTNRRVAVDKQSQPQNQQDESTDPDPSPVVQPLEDVIKSATGTGRKTRSKTANKPGSYS